MATTTVSDYIVQRLNEWGVEHLFAYPGDGINGILGALNRAEKAPQFIQARHEEMAAFEAVGYAKFSKNPGVCLATSGPGAIHLLNGLYDAKLDHVPVVAIVGQTARTAIGGHFQQEVDLQVLFKDVASEYCVTANTPQQFPLVIDRAMRIAQSNRCVTCVIIPSDLQDMEYTPPGHTFKQMKSSLGFSWPETFPSDDQLRQAADILNAGQKVAILVGQGARAAREEVLQAADLLGAGISKALLGKDVIPDTNPLCCGPIGLLGSKPSWDMMMGCDTLLMIGSSFPYSQFLPEYGKAKAVQIDVDARMIGIRYPMDVNLVGDSQRTLQRLLPMLTRKEDRSWQNMLKGEIEEWWELLESRAHLSAHPINPQLVFWEASSRLPSNAIISSDSGSSANWYARDIKMHGDMRGSLSGNLATMGPGVPYAIGAKFAHPDRPVFAFVGDGAMQMNGINELITISKYWREWADPRLVVLVLNNSDLNQVTWEMRGMEGDPKYDASQDLPPFRYAQYADMLGLRGIYVDHPEQIGKAWDEAIASDRPVVLDVVTDPNVPPLPPHVTFEQAKAFTESIVKGDQQGPKYAVQGFKEKVQEFLPGQ